MTTEDQPYHPFLISIVVLLAIVAKLATSWQILIEVYGSIDPTPMVIAAISDILFTIIIYRGIRDYLPEQVHKYALLYVVFETAYLGWWTLNMATSLDLIYSFWAWMMLQAPALLALAKMLKEFNQLNSDPAYANNTFVHSSRLSTSSEIGYHFFLITGFVCLFVPAIPPLGFIIYLITMFLYPIMYAILLNSVSTIVLTDENPPKERWVTPAS